VDPAPRTQLQVLSLWGNSIGDAGAIVVAGALPSVPQLSTLDLRINTSARRAVHAAAPAGCSVNF